MLYGLFNSFEIFRFHFQLHPVFFVIIKVQSLAVNPVTRPRSKHIAIDYRFVRELIANGSLKIDFVPSHMQLADSLTKGVTKPQFFLFRSKLSVLPSPMLTLQGVIRENLMILHNIRCNLFCYCNIANV
jgi:hypothetical protein